MSIFFRSFFFYHTVNLAKKSIWDYNNLVKLILTAVEEPLAEAWATFCGDLDFVTVHHGSILDIECDAVVSPANSFGFMDGGIDALYMLHFGAKIETRVRKQILEHHRGELLVGQADIVETGDTKIPFLIAAPTMRVPMILTDTVNPYLAARAVFRLWQEGVFTSGAFHGEKIATHVQTIALPGLGTGVGRVSASICAHQVRAAIDDMLQGTYTLPKSWAEASERHQLLYTTKLKRLQY
jgi:O-acetyl-ADP-ribose deacetylase (regulator of RNase III)